MRNLTAVAVATIVMMASLVFAAHNSNVPLMNKEDLLKRLDDPNTIVLDVRKGTDWRASEFMIKGAIRLNIKDISNAQYPMDKTIVLYCA